MEPEDIPAFQAALLDWYAHAARDLPFRRTRDPYAIWVSEIMLQQTTVAAVLPYWERFLARFPNVEALAVAPLDDVLHAWAGLGYYSRARNLHAAAREIVDRFGGEFPQDPRDIRALPGIGRYTAGAIASFAFNRDAPVVDANVARVLARIETIPGDPKSSATHKALWSAAERLLPHRRARDWNLALFDLGATVCVPVAPRCLVCPVSRFCRAFREGRQEDFPQVPARAPMAEQADVAAVIRDESGRLLMVRRPETGVWAGMWELPRGTLEPGEDPRAGLARIVRTCLGVELEIGAPAGTVRHTVMRRRITLRAFYARIASGTLNPSGGPPWRWVAPEETAHLALSSPQRRLLTNVIGSEFTTGGTEDTEGHRGDQ